MVNRAENDLFSLLRYYSIHHHPKHSITDNYCEWPLGEALEKGTIFSIYFYFSIVLFHRLAPTHQVNVVRSWKLVFNFLLIRIFKILLRFVHLFLWQIVYLDALGRSFIYYFLNKFRRLELIYVRKVHPADKKAFTKSCLQWFPLKKIAMNGPEFWKKVRLLFYRPSLVLWTLVSCWLLSIDIAEGLGNLGFYELTFFWCSLEAYTTVKVILNFVLSEVRSCWFIITGCRHNLPSPFNRGNPYGRWILV